MVVAERADPRPADTRRLVRRTRTTGRARAVAVSAVLAAATAFVFCLSLTIGDFPVPLLDVPAAVLGLGDPGSAFVVGKLRLPRALTAVLVGAAFGLSGAVFQSLAANPLASPDIIGISAGAATAAVLAIVVFGGTGLALPAAALAGALLTATLVYLLAYRRGLSPYRLVLVGIGVAAALSSVTSFLLTRAEVYEAQRALVWLTGSLDGRGWEHVRPIALALLVLVPAVLSLGPALRTMQLGDDAARGLGLRVEPARAALVLTGVGLAAAATAAAGPVAFVAFVAAPIARRLVGAPLTLVPAALAGALLLVTADLAARQAFGAVDLPVGVVTGLVGAPYLVWLLARANRIGRGG